MQTLSHVELALQNARVYDPDELDLQDVADALTSGDGSLETIRAPFYCTHKPRMTTVADLGEQLPTGVVVDGQVRKDFELRQQTTEVDLEIQKVLAAPAYQQNRGRAISALVALSCEHIAGVPMRTANSKALAFVGSLASSDVTYILALRGLRRSNGRLPVLVDSSDICPNCQAPLRKGLDAGESAIHVSTFEWKPDARPLASVELSREYLIGESTVIDAVAVEAVSWLGGVGGARTEAETANPAWIRQQLLGNAIVGYRTTDGKFFDGGVPAQALLQLQVWDADAIQMACQFTSGDVFPMALGKHDCGEVVVVPFDLGALVRR